MGKKIIKQYNLIFYSGDEVLLEKLNSVENRKKTKLIKDLLIKHFDITTDKC